MPKSTAQKLAYQAKYNASPEQKALGVERRRERRHAIAEGKVAIGDGKDLAHKKALDKGGSNKDGYAIQTAAKNRSFKRDSKGNLLAEVSKKERSR